MTGACRACGRHIVVEQGCEPCALKSSLAFAFALLAFAGLVAAL